MYIIPRQLYMNSDPVPTCFSENGSSADTKSVSSSKTEESTCKMLESHKEYGFDHSGQCILGDGYNPFQRSFFLA